MQNRPISVGRLKLCLFILYAYVGARGINYVLCSERRLGIFWYEFVMNVEDATLSLLRKLLGFCTFRDYLLLPYR